MSERGHYGRNGAARIGQYAQPRTIYVEREHTSTGTWILGALAVGGGLLWARHQSRQMEAIYKTSGMPYQSFTADLTARAKSLPSRAKETFRSFRSAPAAPSPAPAPELAAEPAHARKARSRAR